MQPDSGSCLLLSANLLLFATVRIQATPVDAFGAIACALQLVRSTDLSAQTSTLDASADCPSAYFPRKSTRQSLPCGTLAHVRWPAFSAPSTFFQVTEPLLVACSSTRSALRQFVTFTVRVRSAGVLGLDFIGSAAAGAATTADSAAAVVTAKIRFRMNLLPALKLGQDIGGRIASRLVYALGRRAFLGGKTYLESSRTNRFASTRSSICWKVGSTRYSERSSVSFTSSPFASLIRKPPAS